MRTKIVNLSFPENMLDDMDKAAKKEYRSRSELVREAVRRYLLRKELNAQYAYSERKAKELGIKPGDVTQLVREYRTGK
jgi:CopG family transcriptional regulator/antitoxin EndoAI